MLTKNYIMEQLKSHKPEIEKFGVNKIGLYGSYVREEFTSKSDIDILIDFMFTCVNNLSFENFHRTLQ